MQYYLFKVSKDGSKSLNMIIRFFNNIDRSVYENVRNHIIESHANFFMPHCLHKILQNLIFTLIRCLVFSCLQYT